MYQVHYAIYKAIKRGLIELPACLHILIPFNYLPFRRPFRDHPVRNRKMPITFHLPV